MTTILAIIGVWCWISLAIGGAMIARADYLDGELPGAQAILFPLVGALCPPLWAVAVVLAGWDSWREARERAWANEECEDLR